MTGAIMDEPQSHGGSGSKQAVRDRLAKAVVLDNVFPTAGGEASGIAPDELQRFGTAEAVSPADYAAPFRNMMDAVAIDPMGDLLEVAALRNQMLGLAGAGLLLFRAPELALSSLEERSALGANGSVTRVLIDDERVLLETPRLVVQFAGHVDEARRIELAHQADVMPFRTLGFMENGFIASVLRGMATDACLALMNDDDVLFAEPDFLEHVGQRYRPNDPLIASQWHLDAIDAECAWDITNGDGVRMAVIDNEFDIAHGDLRFGDLSGWYSQTSNFADADFVPGHAAIRPARDPSRSHGTECAGMAGAIGDNGSGGCGVAWGSAISMIACLGDQVGSQSTLARAIGYAANPASEGVDRRGADVVSCSLGPSSDASWTLSETLRLAIESLRRGRDGKGVPLFWAATNGPHPIAADKVCSHPDVMAVSRSTRAGLDDSSGFGPELAFLAPGRNVQIPTVGGGHRVTTGTSFAAPCAAGVGALMLAKNPALSARDLRQKMQDSCDKEGPLPYVAGRNDRFGHGLVNAYSAVLAA